MGNDEAVLYVTLEELIAIQHHLRTEHDVGSGLQEQIGRGIITLHDLPDGEEWGIRLDKIDTKYLIDKIPILYIQGNQALGYRINKKLFALMYEEGEVDRIVNEAWEKIE